VYSEKVGMKQVKPEAVDMLHQYFGGYHRIEKSSAKNGKPLHAWSVTDKKAVACVRAVLPYLRIKRQQAEILLALRVSKSESRTGWRLAKTWRNRWGQEVTRRQRVVGVEQIARRQELFEQIKFLNDTRPTQPKLG
ncbi:MAG: hypothetical protein V3V32_04660, partial [Dehalococcoidia bacterium]